VKQKFLQTCFFALILGPFAHVAAMQQKSTIPLDFFQLEIKPRYRFGNFVFEVPVKSRAADSLTIHVSETCADRSHFILSKVEFKLLFRKEVDAVSVSTDDLHFTRYFRLANEPKEIIVKTDLGFWFSAQGLSLLRNPNQQVIPRCLMQILGMLLNTEVGEHVETIKCAGCGKSLFHQEGTKECIAGHARTMTGLLYCDNEKCLNALKDQGYIIVSAHTDDDSFRQKIADAMKIVHKNGGFFMDKDEVFRLSSRLNFGGDLLFDEKFDSDSDE